MRSFSVMFMLLILSATSYASEINLSGDVRARHEVVDDSTAAQATRQRVRARLYAETQVSDKTLVGLGIATGTANSRSTNQTVGGNFSSKSINLDTAFIQTELLGSQVTVGKFKNTLQTQSELFWDSDVRPEGVSMTSELKGFQLTSAYLVLDDSANNDPSLIVGQLGYGGENFELNGSYSTTQGVATKESYVNVNGALLCGSKFKSVLFGEYNVNVETGTDDQAWLAGFGASYKGVSLKYAYREVEANGVNALLTDSDFGNGVDVKGSEVNLAYTYDKVKVGATYFVLDNGINNGTDYDTLQVDLAVSF